MKPSKCPIYPQNLKLRVWLTLNFQTVGEHYPANNSTIHANVGDVTFKWE
jgi:hypothetical protein